LLTEADVAVRKARDVVNVAASKMVASTHNLDDLGVSHIASASHQHQSHHHSQRIQQATDKSQHSHTYGKSNQSAQDKRSRLSNVINNLHKKVPPETTKCDSQIIKTEDGKNSVECNLKTLEKYVMTVLSGVIESEEKNSNKKELESERQPKDSLTKPVEVITTKDAKDSNGAVVAVPSREEDAFPDTEVSFEPSEANENKVDAAVPSSDEAVNKDENKMADGEKKEEIDNTGGTKITELSDSSAATPGDKDVVDACNSRCRNQKWEEMDESPRTLGAIILDRLTDRHQDQSGSEEIKKETIDSEVRIVCQELLSDLLNDIIQVIEGPSQTVVQTIQNATESNSDNSTQSLHCSLPLDKVASVLQTCQTLNILPPQMSNVSSMSVQSSSPKIASSSHLMDKSSVKSPLKPISPTVRHLCLYCDRKFLSISLRQRHTERVHQASGGRRSERNSRKPSQQNCQHCVYKCLENLEGLFQHMVSSHSDKYHGCLQCSTRYLSRDALTLHIHEIHSHVTVQMEKLKEPILTSIKEIKTSSEAVISAKEESTTVVVKQLPPTRDQLVNPSSPTFDNSFYSSVSCNIRENLLHHIDGKIQMDSSPAPSTSPTVNSSAASPDSSSKTPQYQLPIDISLTAVTPVYSKDYPMAPEDYENSSEHAGKPGKPCNRSHPRRVSFEKYNFPRKYDGKEQWSCSIKDLSKFDISTQLTLRKKQRFIKECTTLNRLEKIMLCSDIEERTEGEQKSVDCKIEQVENIVVSSANADKVADSVQSEEIVISGGGDDSEKKDSDECTNASQPVEETPKEPTVFSSEFESFMRLKKRSGGNSDKEKLTVAYAELTGEWSRPRVYVCGACAERYVSISKLL
jgi:hypothetical protein